MSMKKLFTAVSRMVLSIAFNVNAWILYTVGCALWDPFGLTTISCVISMICGGIFLILALLNLYTSLFD